MARSARLIVFMVLALAASCVVQPAPEPAPAPAPQPAAQVGAECAPERCGPALGMPNQTCPDGSVGGPTGRCLVTEGGTCGWEVRECPPAQEPPPAQAACVRGGCSGELCIEEGRDVMSTCQHRPEYDCYRDAACERQADGECGFTQTPELSACLSAAAGK